MGVPLANASGRCIPHFACAAVLHCVSHCLTACSMPLTQFNPGF
ncbi:MAG: hypothetical protein NZ455_15350 [Bacteroidia bacterium]|nr:hypothetical protein [Bacteroidia bacterium]MDW8348042.1 hypothetical protein [Bacteroidia bacterium]